MYRPERLQLERSGRLVLIDSTLTAALFSFDVFGSSCMVLKLYKQTATSVFLVGFDVGEEAIVSHGMICSSKMFGGLGVKNLRLLNMALRRGGEGWTWERMTSRGRFFRSPYLHMSGRSV
jgi:hypothetical protein